MGYGSAAGNDQKERNALMKAPHTYAEWSDVLDLLERKTDDEGVLAAMQQGTLEWQSGVAERFSQRLVNAVNARMNAASDRMQNHINHANGQERVIIQELLALRKELGFLAQCMNISVIPESGRQQYQKLVRDQADTIQTSIEDWARQDRSGKLTYLVHNHKVNVF